MNIVVVTPPAVEPVTTQEAFTHLRVDADPDAIEQHVDYATIQGYVATAREQCEKYLRRAIVQQTLRMTLSGWGRDACSWRPYSAGFELRRPPFLSVVSVTYRDLANVQQTVQPAEYFVTEDLVPRLVFTTGFAAPTVYPRDDAIAVTYVAGYPPGLSDPQAPDLRANVPQSIKSAVLLGAELLYDKHAPDERASLERAQTALLSPFRITTI
ncbi:head-tail connector protein [Aquincola tertiaricarbonis]|uniref:head-tail connector protein n=1 Tax=Aquincola tertiaricarbonis TaxID=391953 RepID=UPI0006150F04|nr:hypothetical protein [Aquincola tertiaricarbonis]